MIANNNEQTSTTPEHIVERNRRNAQKSTGPKTAAGKAVSRRNAITHGLTANPAVGTIEDPEQFDALLQELYAAINPTNAIEDTFVRNIAMSLWRMERAIKIDQSTGLIAASQTTPIDEKVDYWVEYITTNFSEEIRYQVTDSQVIKQRIERRLMLPGSKCFLRKRIGLITLDRERNELMQNQYALLAMIKLLEILAWKLVKFQYFSTYDAQGMAWLMGKSGERLLPEGDDVDRIADFYPDEKALASPIDLLIGEARNRARDQPVNPAMTHAYRGRITNLRTRSRSIFEDAGLSHDEAYRTGALLPEASLLDRIIRYETHAARSLKRSIGMLAELRGTSIKSIMTKMSNLNALQPR